MMIGSYKQLNEVRNKTIIGLKYWKNQTEYSNWKVRNKTIIGLK
mgnify:CR=1 FL=1